jgi:predicted MPP superfamily phosphohydrolase
MSFFVFFLIWFVLLGFGYWYVGRRVGRAANLSGSKRVLAWIVVGVLFLLPQVPFLLLVSRVEAAWMDLLSWAGYIILGLFSLVLTGFVLRDLVLLLTQLAAKAAEVLSSGQRDGGQPFDKERRRFVVHSTNLGIMSLAAISGGYGLYESRRRATIEEVTVPLEGLPKEFNGFRIAQFTDIHVGPTIKREYVEGVVEQLNELQPDMIAFTGDLVDGSVGWLKDDVAPLRELSAPHGRYFVTGNHEYYSGAGPWVEEAGRLGFDVLMNEHRMLTRGEGRIVLAGVTDYSAGQFDPDGASNPAASIADAPAGVVRILLAHQPRSIHKAAAAGFDLQLSGHTHGGQFFPWNYLAALNQPYISGLHKHGGTWIYVNRGTGYWGPPLRLGIPPEITVITLKGG